MDIWPPAPPAPETVGASRAAIAADNTGGAAGAVSVDWRKGIFRFNNSATPT